VIGAAVHWLIASILGAWFAVTVANQFDSVRTKSIIQAHDPLGLVPIWTFFAPRPGMSDYHLVYRQVSPSQPMTDWTEIPIVTIRHWSHIFWNPNRRRAKVVSDCMHALGAEVQDARQNSVESPTLQRRLLVSIPYLTLLSIVMAYDAKCVPEGAYRQFAIVERRDLQAAKITVVLCSTLHPCTTVDENARHGA
jgi:hypothetical protein